MIVYIQPHTRATSPITAVSGSTQTTLFVADNSTPVPPLSAALDRKRGITNAPVFDAAHPGDSSILGGFKRNKSPAPSMRSTILPSNTGAKSWDSQSSITVRPVQRVRGHGSRAVQPQPRTLEQWRETEIAQEETRRFERRLVQHIEDEKVRIRKIAFGAHSRRGKYGIYVVITGLRIIILLDTHSPTDPIDWIKVFCELSPPFMSRQRVMLDKPRTISCLVLIDWIAFGLGLPGSGIGSWVEAGMHIYGRIAHRALPSRVFVCNWIFTLVRTLKLEVTHVFLS